MRGDRATDVFGAGGATQVGRARAVFQAMLDGGQDGVVRVLAAQELQHQRARPDHGDRVGDALAIDVRRRPVHGFEQRREFAFRVQVRRRRDADGAGAGRAQVRQDVAEEVARDDDVELARVAHQLHRGVVDVHVRQLDVGIFARHLNDDIAPELRGFQHVGLVHRGDLATALLRQAEGTA
ncbi:hypothetical protein G6F31_014497 [Rhizopus arrhizus]|nr:hypothetical protein G6F31_014497 [Rhizopus arrhizus]